MYERDDIFTAILPFIIGALIGAGVALLMAPQSGQKTRSLIRDKSAEIKDKAIDTVEDTRSRANKAIDDLSQQTKDRISTVTKRGQELQEKVDEEARRARRRVKA